MYLGVYFNTLGLKMNYKVFHKFFYKEFKKKIVQRHNLNGLILKCIQNSKKSELLCSRIG